MLEGKWLQNWLQADKNELKSLSAVDIRDTNVEVSAFSPNDNIHLCMKLLN